MGYRKPKRKFLIPLRVAERAATRFEIDDDGCWISTYSVASHGYAQIGWKDTKRQFRQIVTAHRAAWVYHHGQIPPAMTIDHLCRTRRCVNPDHLELATNLENSRGGGGFNKKKPVPTDELCGRGHVVLQFPSGSKHCRECAIDWARAKRHRTQLSRAQKKVA